MESRSISRRGFIAAGAAGVAGIAGGAAFAAPAPAPARADGPADRIRTAFIGVGGRGNTLLGVALGNRLVEIGAICDLDLGRANAAADRVEKAHGERPAVFDDHRKLLAAAKVDAVVSATPCCEHFKIYRDCVEAGKHLYGEKPMCVSVKEADELVAAQAKSPKVKVQIGHQRRSNPRFIESVKLIREDRVLGDLIEGRCSFNNDWGPPEGLGGKGHWLSKVARSGDWMVEQAVHTWDVMNWVAGATPLRAFGLGRPGVFKGFDPDRDVHDFYTAVLEYPGGLTIHFNHSWICPSHPFFAGCYDRYLGLLGGIDIGEGKIIYSNRSDRKGTVQTIQPDVTDDTKISLDSFFDAIRTDRKPYSTVHNGRDAVLVGLLVRKAVAEKRVVTWEEMLKSC